MCADRPEPKPSSRQFWGERTPPLTVEERVRRGATADSRPAFSGGRGDETSPAGRDLVGPPLQATRHARAFYRDGISPDVGYAGYRPPGVDLAYTPQVAVRRRVVPPMQRINGGICVPQTFENRHLLHDTSYPWGCIGRVSTHDDSGTGVLVGRNLVVTAAHVINWGDHRPVSFDTTYVAEPGTEANVIEIRGFDTVLTGYDWAILKLDQPLGDRLVIWGSTAIRQTGRTSRSGRSSGIPRVSVRFGNREFPSMTTTRTITADKSSSRRTRTR
jgi:Trypsin